MSQTQVPFEMVLDKSVNDQERQLKDSYSWKCLHDVYRSKYLTQRIEKLELQFNSSNEMISFAPLVNTSTSMKFPYHRWIRYREGYAGELVKELIRRYPSPEDTVIVDPMCGSGSTMVACNELGLSSIGMDVSPFAVKATQCKGLTLSHSQVSSLISRAKKMVEVANGLNAPFSKFDQDIEKYFPRENLQQLVNLKQSVTSLQKSVIKEALEFSLLAILEDCSNRKKDGNGLATRQTKIKDCYAAFLAKVEIIAEDYKEYPNTTNSDAFVHDARYLNNEAVLSALGSRKVGAIIFSPPYANSFDYFESYKLELIFSEWTLSKELNQKRKSLIRNYRLNSREVLCSEIPEVELLCEEILVRIPEKEEITGVRDGRTRLVPNMLRSYFADMGKVVESGMEILAPGSCMHIVVDQSAYVGVPIPTDTILAVIGKQAGFEVVNITQCRKAKTSGQQLKSFPYLKDLLRETIVTLRKPILNRPGF